MCADSIAEESKVADSDETIGKNVQREAPQKLAGIKLELLLSIVIPIILIREAYGLTVERAKTVLGDGNTMGVPRQIRENLCWTTKRRLCIDDPIESPCLLKERSAIEARGTLAKRSVLAQSIAKEGEKTGAEVPGHHHDRKKEVLSAHDDKSTVVDRDSTTWNHTMKMRMERERLTPGMEDRKKAEYETEMARITADDEQRLTDGTEQEIVEKTQIGKGEGVEQFGDGEDDVKVRNRKQLALPLREPPSARLELAARAVPIATRVPGELAIVALGAAIEMSTKCRSLTAANGAQGAALWSVQRPAGFELGPNLADDLTE